MICLRKQHGSLLRRRPGGNRRQGPHGTPKDNRDRTSQKHPRNPETQGLQGPLGPIKLQQPKSLTSSHKVSQGPTRFHKLANGLRRCHRVLQVLIRSHQTSHDLQRSHQVPQGLSFKWFHKVSKGITRFHHWHASKMNHHKAL